MCAPKPPSAPTPPSVAEQTQGNIATARASEQINNPNQVNPYGSVTYTSGDTFDEAGYNDAYNKWLTQPNTRQWNPLQLDEMGNPLPGQGSTERNEQGQIGFWTGTARGAAPTKETFTTSGRNTVTQRLSPEEQAIFSANQANRLGLNRLAGTGINKAQGILGQEVDYSGAPAAPDVQQGALRQKVIDAMLSRADPALSRANAQQDADLIAAGIRPGTAAWDRVKGEQGRNRNDMLMQAELAGGGAAQQEFGMGSEARRNYISELLSKRSIPLNEITALMSGQQIQNPFAGGSGGGGGAQVKSPDYFSGANMLNQYNQDIYNQNVGTHNARGSAAATIGSAILTSDRRLKTKIKRVGTHKLGIGIYTWEYVKKAPKGMENLANWGGKSIGVMADEVRKVMPQAVIRVGDYDAVNYALIGA